MGIADAFAKEDRVEVTFSDFYKLMKESTKAEIVMNAVNCNVPHKYIREMVTGKSEAPGQIHGRDMDRVGLPLKPLMHD
mgnify:FL=1